MLNNTHLLLFVFCSILHITGFAQINATKPQDVHVSPKPVVDTAKVYQSFRIALKHSLTGDFDAAQKNLKSTLRLAEITGYKPIIARTYNLQANIYLRTGNYLECIICSNKALFAALHSRDSVSLSTAYNCLGSAYAYLGDHVKALKYFFKSLDIEEKIKIQNNLHWTYSNIGNLYNVQKNFQKAQEYCYKAIVVEERIKDYRALSLTLSNMGIIFMQMNQNDSSLFYYKRALNAANISKDTFSIANSMASIGILYTQLKQYNTANGYSIMSYKLAQSHGLMDVCIYNLSNLATINQELKNYDKAEKYFKEGISLSKKIGAQQILEEMYLSLANLYKQEQKFQNAFTYYKLCSEVKNIRLNQEANKLIAELNGKYIAEKKEKEIELLKKTEGVQNLEIDRKKIELDKQQTISIGTSIGVFLVAVVTLLMFSFYRIKEKANDQLQKATAVITQKNKAIEKGNALITDSIAYAKQIQDAILPTAKDLSNALSDNYFIFYQPIHIVSGDFYWCSVRNQKSIFVVADCTGHGVPGAFMSMIGNTLLNEIVNERKITEPQKIAQELDKKIIHALHQHSGSNQYDGMDISICSIDKEKREITYTGAHHSMYSFNGELTKIKGDNYSIGGAQHQKVKLFTAQTIAYEAGSRFYFLTDGYCDQSGGTQNKRFTSRQFESMLTELQNLPMTAQKEKLKHAFDDWKQESKQRDDVLVVGIEC